MCTHTLSECSCRCPGTSLATSTLSNFRWQPVIESQTLRFPPQYPTGWATTAPIKILWSSYLPFDPISARVCNCYEGRSNQKGSMLLYSLGLPVLKEYDEGNLVLKIKINHTHHPADDPEWMLHVLTRTGSGGILLFWNWGKTDQTTITKNFYL